MPKGHQIVEGQNSDSARVFPREHGDRRALFAMKGHYPPAEWPLLTSLLKFLQQAVP